MAEKKLKILKKRKFELSHLGYEKNPRGGSGGKKKRKREIVLQGKGRGKAWHREEVGARLGVRALKGRHAAMRSMTKVPSFPFAGYGLRWGGREGRKWEGGGSVWNCRPQIKSISSSKA